MSDALDRVAALSPHQQEALARRLRTGRPTAASESPIPRRRTTRPPLSFAQQRLWFLDQMDPGSPHYNMPMAARIRGPLSVPILERSLNVLVGRHEALRTTFELVDGGPAQVIHESLWVPLPVTDLCHVPATERQAEADRLMVERSREPFDLATGPLVRAGVLRLEPDCHVLVATLHHIIADAWSIDIILRELTVTYEALRHGQDPPLGDPPLQFPDYAQWQRDWLRGDVLQSQVDYWRGQLDGELAMLDLPTDRPRPPEQTFRGARHVHRLPAGLSRRLDALCAQAGTTPFTLHLAGLSVLMHRYSGQDRIGIGVPIANRTRVDLEGMVAFLANTVLLRTSLAGDPSFRQVLQRAHESNVGAHANQDLPFDKIVELVRPERSLSATPLLQVVLVFQSAVRDQDVDSSGLTGQTEALAVIDNRTSKFDLTFGVESDGDAYVIGVEYSTDLFDAETIERMGGHLEALLEGAADDPDLPIGALPLLSAEERHRTLVDWNATETEFPRDQCLHELIAAQARRQPTAVAAIHQDEELTYSELDHRANQLAHRLCALGAAPDVPVALSMHKSIDLVVAMVGILKSGGAYLPIDPNYPAERVSLMLAAARARILVTEDEVAARLDVGGGVAVVRVDTDRPEIGREPATPPAVDVTPEHLAYLIFTSGSTGRPKGVLLDHRGRVNNFHDVNQRFAVGPGDSILALASLGFDMSAYDILGTLMAGARIVLIERDGDRDAAHWLDLMRRHHVTVWHSVPALLEMLVEYAALVPDLALPALRLVLLGGDWIPLSLPDRLRALADRARVVSLGGATEVSMDSTIYEVDRVDPAWRSVPYGRPMANQRCYVLDSRLRPVPVNVPGDLYLAGVGVGRGYLEDPALTAARFIPSPVPEEPGGRVYRTGDLARYRPDGSLELLGRSDGQVKIRGWRIEPGEVEAALREHPDVKDALVTTWADPAGGRHLVAYLITREGGTVDVAAVADQLRERLPAHLVPAFLVPLDGLPLTPNGKVDRSCLPDPHTGTGPDADTYTPPRGRVESVLAEVWQDLLAVPQVSVTDNFFALGGDSIKSIQAIARLRKRGLVLTPKQMFQHQTIAALARVAVDSEPLGTEGHDEDRPLVTPEQLRLLLSTYPDLADAYPLSPMQLRMLRLATTAAVPGLYIIQADYLFVAGGLDLDHLRSAWQYVTDRHPSLRTSFAWAGLAEPLQVVHPTVDVPIEHHDFRGLTVAEQVRRQDDLVQADRRRGFDLTRAPLLRLHLTRVADDTYLYLFTNHHIILDGWSRAIVQQEVFAVYEALLRGDPPQVPTARPVKDYLAWLRSRDLRAAERFWRGYLDGFDTPTPLVRTRGRPEPSRQGPFAKQNLPLDRDTFLEVRAFCRRATLTPNTVMQGAWLLLMSRYTGELDLVLGVTSSGRSTEFHGVDTVTGLCMNTLPVRVRVEPDRPVLAWLADVQTMQLDVRQYEYTPLDSIAAWAGMPADASLFECMMVFENYPWDGSLLQLADRIDGEHPLAQTDCQLAQFEFPLRVEVAPGGNNLLIMHYYRDSFSDETVTAMLDDWRQMIKAVVAAPDSSLARLIRG